MKHVRCLGFLLCLLFTAQLMFASDVVLVPVFYGAQGALGSDWRTRLTVVNGSDKELTGLWTFQICAIPEGCQQPFPAHATMTKDATSGFQYNNGFFLSPGVAGADVSYSLRVYDQSRNEVNYGTAIPVVPVDDFSQLPLQLPDVPNDPRFRVTLRVYAVPPASPVARVRLYQDAPFPKGIEGTQPPSALLAERTVQLPLPPYWNGLRSWTQPSGTVISDLLSGVGPSVSSIRVEVQSVTDGVPVWALLTVTNNETQFVTIVVPRKSPML